MAVEIPEGFDEDYLRSLEEQAAQQQARVPQPFSWGLAENMPGGGTPIAAIPPGLEALLAPQKVQPDIWAPLLPLSKLAPSPRTVQDALQVLSASSPELTQEEAQNVMETGVPPLEQQPVSTGSKAIAGVEESLLRGAEGMTSLPMLATAGLAEAPALVGRVASAAFTADMLRHLPQAWESFRTALKGGDPQKIASTATDLAQLGAFTVVGGAHTLDIGAKPTSTLVPEAERALAETPTPQAEAPAPVVPEAPAPTTRSDIKNQVLNDIKADNAEGPYLYHQTDTIEPIVRNGLNAGGLAGLPIAEHGYGNVVHVFNRADFPAGTPTSDVSYAGGIKGTKPIATFTLGELGIKPEEMGYGARAAELGYEQEPPVPYTPEEKTMLARNEQAREAKIQAAYTPKTLPMAPRAGEAGAINLEPLREAGQQVNEFLGNAADQAKSQFRVINAQLAGHAVPHISTASEASGNAVVQYAAARIGAPEVAKSMATDVLGEHYKDNAFSLKLGAVLVEDRLLAIKDAFVRAGQRYKADNVNTIIGQEGSPLQTEADFQAALADPEIQAAIQRHKDTVQQAAQTAHEELGGQLAGPGLNTGAFVNLKAIFEGGEENLLSGGGRGNLTNPLKRPSKFIKPAAGTAHTYELDYRTLANRMIEGNFEEVAKRRMYDQLEADGLAVVADPGEYGKEGPTIGGKKAVKFNIERRGVPAGERVARTMIKDLWVRSDLAPEVRQALNVDGAVQQAGLARAANLLNTIQLAGPTDAVVHTVNMISSIAGSPGGKTALVDMVRALPYVNVADALGRVAASSIRVLRDNPDIQRQIAGLARIGTTRGAPPKPTGWKRFTPNAYTHQFIRFIDHAGRLVRDDMYQNLVRRGMKDSEANRREWINQMGQYNPRLMGQFQRIFREMGLSPFIVAGRNFNLQAARRLTLSPGIEAASTGAAIQIRAMKLLGNVATLIAIPSLANFLLTGSPSGRSGTKFGQIDTGRDDKDGKHIVIDPAQWIGLRRGMRNFGIDATIEGLRQGKSGKNITNQALKDAFAGAIHPWAGPAVTAGMVARFGVTPGGYQESKNPKDIGANVQAALKQMNPLASSVIKGAEEEMGDTKTAGAATEVGKSLAKAVGVKFVRPITAKDKLANLHAKWLAANPDPRIAADAEAFDAATLPVGKYRLLDRALEGTDKKAIAQAIEEIRPMVSKDSDIVNRMRPVIIDENKMTITPKTMFHSSKKLEQQFRDSLTPEQQKLWQQALEDRQKRWELFKQVWEKRGPTPHRGPPEPAPATP